MGHINFRDPTGIFKDILKKIKQRHMFLTLSEAFTYMMFKFVDDEKLDYSDEELKQRIIMTRTLKEMDKDSPLIRSMYAIENINKSVLIMLMGNNDIKNIMFIINNTIKKYSNEKKFPHLINEMKELKTHTIKTLLHDRRGLHILLKTGAMSKVDMQKSRIIELRAMITETNEIEYLPPPKRKKK